MRNMRHVFVLAACGIASAPVAAPAATPYIPRYDHVVVVIMENHSAASIYNSTSAGYINSLAGQGAKFTASHGVTHPSQPNYLALFSGSTQNVIDDSCPLSFSADNLAQQLIAAGLSFAQYSEDLPATGDTSCNSGLYARKHNPLPDFPALPASASQPFTNFAAALAGATLPTVSFVVPNLCNDMHGAVSCSSSDLIALGNQWLATNMPQYFASSSGSNGLLIVTWDEDDSSSSANNVPTVFYGPHVKVGVTSATTINHYTVLRTLEDMYGLSALVNAQIETPITDVWDDTIFRNGFD